MTSSCSISSSDTYVVASREWGGVVLNVDAGSMFALGRADGYVASRVALGEGLEQIAVGLSSKFGLRLRQAVDVARSVSVRLAATRELFIVGPSATTGGEPFVQHIITYDASPEEAGAHVRLHLSAVELPEGMILLVGEPTMRAELVTRFREHGHAVIEDPAIELDAGHPSVKVEGNAVRTRAVSQVWLLSSQRKGPGLVLARRHVRETLPNLLRWAVSPAPRSRWARTFETCVTVADLVPLLETVLPMGDDALSAAVEDFCLNARRLGCAP